MEAGAQQVRNPRIQRGGHIGLQEKRRINSNTTHLLADRGHGRAAQGPPGQYVNSGAAIRLVIGDLSRYGSRPSSAQTMHRRSRGTGVSFNVLRAGPDGCRAYRYVAAAIDPADAPAPGPRHHRPQGRSAQSRDVRQTSRSYYRRSPGVGVPKQALINEGKPRSGLGCATRTVDRNCARHQDPE